MRKTSKTRDATMAETRAALIAAGAMEFAEKGLDGPSLDAICARAGFTRGAFYVHFRDRDELLVAVVERVLVGFQEAVLAGDDDDVDGTVARYLAAVAGGSPGAHGVGKWHFHDTLAACSRLPKLRKRYVELQTVAIERLALAAARDQKAGRIRADVDAKALAEILVVLSLGVTAALDVRMPFDLAGGGMALATLLRSVRTERKRS